MKNVGIVIVSHSAKLAEGVKELAAQMAHDVPFAAAGGTDEGGIGTSYAKIEQAVAAVRGQAQSAVILCDLGSATMTAETYVEALDGEDAARVRLVDAPLVEGAVAAGVAAESGDELDAVAQAAEAAWGRAPVEGGAPEAVAPSPAWATAPEAAAASAPAAAAPTPSAASGEPQSVRRSLVLSNGDGLHARPAAQLVKAAAGFDAKITANGVDAKSLLRIMGLGLAKGATLDLEATGPEAQAAIEALSALVENGFGEA